MSKVKTIILTAVGLLGTGCAIYLSVTKKPAKYSLKWIESLSDEQWEVERDIVQSKFLDPTLNLEFREKCRSLLDVFDKVKSIRDWAGETPRGPAYYPEHGSHLYKPD